MSDRLRSIREKLYDYLTHKFRTPGIWTHFRGSRGVNVFARGERTDLHRIEQNGTADKA
jgi:hypothetical protein